MSLVREEVKYYQKCDICGKEIQLRSKKDKLRAVSLPGELALITGGIQPVTVDLSLCDSCYMELKGYLKKKYEIREDEYGGIVANKKE